MAKGPTGETLEVKEEGNCRSVKIKRPDTGKVTNEKGHVRVQ